MPDLDADIVIDRLTPGDARAAAAAHTLAFPQHFLTSLGPTFLAEYYRCVARDDGAIALAARSGATLVGLCVGSPDPRGFYRRLLLRRWWSFGPLAALAAIRRPSRTARLTRALTHSSTQAAGAGSAGLFSIAVIPTHQKHGVGRLLLSAFVVESSKKGCVAIALETDNDDNHSVNRFYERAGFAVIERFVTPEGREMRRYLYDLTQDTRHGDR